MKTLLTLMLTLVLTATLLIGCGCTNQKMDATTVPTVLHLSLVSLLLAEARRYFDQNIDKTNKQTKNIDKMLIVCFPQQLQ